MEEARAERKNRGRYQLCQHTNEHTDTLIHTDKRIQTHSFIRTNTYRCEQAALSELTNVIEQLLPG